MLAISRVIVLAVTAVLLISTVSLLNGSVVLQNTKSGTSSQVHRQLVNSSQGKRDNVSPEPAVQSKDTSSGSGSTEVVYAVTLEETGLPAGTNWWVGIGVLPNLSPAQVDCYETVSWSSVTPFITFDEPNGTYHYVICQMAQGYWNVSGFPTFGNFTVAGAPIFGEVNYTPQELTLIVSASNQIGPWKLTLDVGPGGSTITGDHRVVYNSNSAGQVVVTEPYGRYPYEASSGTYQITYGYLSFLSSGDVNLTFPAAIIGTNTQFYSSLVTFVESGIPENELAEGAWQVWVTPTFSCNCFVGPLNTGFSKTPADGNYFSNGTYDYNISTRFGLVAASGSFTVDGSPLIINLNFKSVFNTVRFYETGLPSGTNWSVEVLAGSAMSWYYTAVGIADGLSYIDLSLPNSNGYSLWASVVDGWTPSFYDNRGLIFSVNVSYPQTVAQVQLGAYQFDAGGVPYYPAAFSESGLPTGGLWSISTPSGWRVVSNQTFLVAGLEPNGTFQFMASQVGNWAPVPAQSTVTVNGAPTHTAVTYIYSYPVVFARPVGLPSGRTWSVTVAGTTTSIASSRVSSALLSSSTLRSTGSSISFHEPNGTYTYSVTATGYGSYDFTGTFQVNGSSPSAVVPSALPPGQSNTFVGNLMTTLGNWTIVGVLILVIVAIGIVMGSLRRRRRSR